LWIKWNRADDRKRKGRSFEELASDPVTPADERQVNLDVERTLLEYVPSEKRPGLQRILFAVANVNPRVRYAQGMNSIAAVFLALGFSDEDTFWLVVCVLEHLLPECHDKQLSGLFRDAEVAEAFMKRWLKERVEQLQKAGVELIWLATDFFLTLAAKDASLALVVRFWDLTFLHGPAAMFSGLLALLDLCLPRTDEILGPEELICKYRAECRTLDPTVFATRVLVFLSEGGVTNEEVEALRSGTATDFEVSSSTNDDSSISTVGTLREKVDLGDRSTSLSMRLSLHRSRSFGEDLSDFDEPLPEQLSGSSSEPDLTEEPDDDSAVQPAQEVETRLGTMVSMLSGF
jgi:hypothetical protein